MSKTDFDEVHSFTSGLELRDQCPSAPQVSAARPASLDDYFARQGAQLDRRLVSGQERLSLTVSGRAGLYSIGACCYGWTEASLWAAWCEHQRALAWHRLWAQHLVVQGQGMGPKGLEALSRWVKSKGIARQSNAYSLWPWSVISRSNMAEPLTYSGNSWLRIENGSIELDVLSIENACVESQFDPNKPREYLLAMEELRSQSVRLWLQATTPCVDLEEVARRL